MTLLEQQLRASLEGRIEPPPSRRVTLSKLELATHCLHSFDIELPEEKRGQRAKKGVEFHDIAKHWVKRRFIKPDPSLVSMVEYWWTQAESILPSEAHIEIAVAWNTETMHGRILGYDINRQYDAHGASLHDDVCGSIDVAWPEGGVVHVVDHKTGARYHAAKDSWQLLGAAAILSDIWKAKRAEVAYHYVTETGLLVPEYAAFEHDELVEAQKKISRIGRVLRGGDTSPKAGPHCDRLYCPARPVCDAYKSTHAKEHATMTVSLSNITKGVVEQPFSVVLYGPEGIGKSTWASGAASPIFIGEPRGTNHLDVARFPNLTTFEEVLSAVDALLTEKHTYKSVVIDPIDWIEGLVWDHVCSKGGKKSISDFGYGKGHDSARDEIRRLLAKLDELHSRGMTTIVLAHSHVRTFRNPAGDDYDHFELRLNGKTAELVRGWPDAVLFANYKTYIVEKDDRVRAVGDGSRIVWTEARPAWHAKNRYGLPGEMPLDWGEFERAARVGAPAAIDDMRSEITRMMAELSDVDKKTASEYATKAGNDARKLSKVRDWMTGKIQLATQGAA